VLERFLRQGARKLLQAAIAGEVAEYIEKHREIRDEAGRRLVVRNGSLPQRELVTGLGAVRTKQPRVHDRRPERPCMLALIGTLEETYPGTAHQRCWVHKTANVLDKLPKWVQPHAKKMLHEMYLAPTKADALQGYQAFLEVCSAKYPKASECLCKDRQVLFTFYDFPAEHWADLRTTNPIESTFATVRHRTRQTKGCGCRIATLSMVFKLATQADKHWRRINGYPLVAPVIEGVRFVDGELERAA